MKEISREKLLNYLKEEIMDMSKAKREWKKRYWVV